MFKRLYPTLFLAFLLLFVPLAQAAGPGEIEARITSFDPDQIQEAITLLAQAIEDNPLDGEAFWLMAKAYYQLGETSAEGHLEIYEKGKEYADQAVELLPDSAHSHFWQAALFGKIGQTKGILNSLFMVGPFRSSLEHVLTLDEDYGDAYCALSQLYLEAPGFPLSIGNKKLALENAEKAAELDPENPTFVFQFAKALQLNGRREEAIEWLERLLALPAIEREPLIKEEAQSLLAQLKTG